MEPTRRNTRPLNEKKTLLQRLSTRRGMTILAIISILFIAFASAGGWYAWSSMQKQKMEIGPEITPPASLSELATQYPELASILQDPELDSAYKDFLVAYQQGGVSEALKLARSRGLINENDDLRLTLELDTQDSAALVAQLEAQGVQVTAVSGNLIDIIVPRLMIEKAMQSGDPGALFRSITELQHVVRIRLPRFNIQDAGKTGLESLGVINAKAWQAAGFTGQGLKVGILDMGFNNYRSFLGKELPDDVTERSFIAGADIDQTDTEHGTAVAEIIHGIAPDAQLFFAAYDTDVEQRQAVDWLAAQGVNIISHSAGSIYGPMDGTGPEAKMVDEVAAQGILWVNSAGNMGKTHYRGKFTDQDGDGFHEFSPGDELMGFVPDGRVAMALNWDAWDTGDQDYDLIVLDKNMNEVASSENIQNGPGDDAAEFINFLFSDQETYYIAFRARNITRPAVFDFYIYGAQALEYSTPEYSLTTPADANGALTVGATFWSDDSFEDYSSEGPSHDGRLKPDISAPTGVKSAVYGEEFFGTSASAPHVAGAAALVWQAFPQFTAQEVADYLKNQARDLGKNGPDPVYGFGRLWLGDAPAVNPGERPTSTPRESASPPPETSIPTEAKLTESPSETPQATATRPPTERPFLTPTPILWPTETPAPENKVNKVNNLMLPLILLCSFSALGFMGLAGVGLLAIVWVRSRPRPRPRPILRPAAWQPARAAQVAAQMPQPPAPQPAQPAARPPAPISPAPADVQEACPRCGAPHRPQARFCQACGLKLEAAGPSSPASQVPRYCVHCGQFLRPESKFCPRCGRQR